tara:strand:+ start:5832 stop:7589 length:1758 start_codon:yes stop_codon:yes gene_type:complete
MPSVSGERRTPPSRQFNFNKEDAVGASERVNPEYTNSVASSFISNKYSRTYAVQKYLPDNVEAPQDTLPGVGSIANRYALFQYRSPLGNLSNAEDYLDAPNSKIKRITDLSKNPTTSNIIQAFSDLGKQGMQYSWGDFLYSKYHGKIPNNYMVTIRRFAMPIGDNLWDPSQYDHKSGEVIDTDQPEIARAITYMGEETGNALENFVSWSNKFNWKEVESEMQVMQSNSQGIKGSSILGVGTEGFGVGSAISSASTLGSGQTSASAKQTAAAGGFDALKETYPNYIEGPLNVIKKLLIQDQGLEFSQEFEVKFHYNLQAHGKINPKMAFLDILANLLVLSYNNAPFWGGAARYVGNGNFGKPLGDHNLLAGGDLVGFLKSVVSDVGGLLSKTFGDGAGGFSLESVLGGMGDVAGDMLGGWLSENLNSPQGPQVAAAFLSGDPTGKWHVTVGNPLNPVVMIGNLVLDDTAFKLHGPLGRDDFPTELEVTMKFKHARPRDKQDIESMFTMGKGRLYSSPEGLEDVLNTEGKEPKKQTGYPKNTPGERTGSKKKSKRYSDNLDEAWASAGDASNSAATKIKNVYRYAID